MKWGERVIKNVKGGKGMLRECKELERVGGN